MMATPTHGSALMQYCPACGHCAFRANSPKSFLCSRCGFILYMNAAAAVAALIESNGDLLLTVRAHNPSAGMLDLPGGFVDHQETIEAALVRELREELGVDIVAAMMGDRSTSPHSLSPHSTSPRSSSSLSQTNTSTHKYTTLTSCYVGSYPNTYHYRGITYETVDMFYQIVLPHKPDLQADDDVSDLIWVPKQEIPFDDIAFSSARDILQQCYSSSTDAR
ncbi:MAG: NUDIX domain-containing protein [Cyanothece sp. SIO2G6]|nr:NUDIX domain-containing protein [Cyanothece sp. SIO2G6]